MSSIWVACGKAAAQTTICVLIPVLNFLDVMMEDCMRVCWLDGDVSHQSGTQKSYSRNWTHTNSKMCLTHGEFRTLHNMWDLPRRTCIRANAFNWHKWPRVRGKQWGGWICWCQSDFEWLKQKMLVNNSETISLSWMTGHKSKDVKSNYSLGHFIGH